ncbi:MAG: MFS transporter [Desulfarculaceae bacterium]|nr:MFS transporter [Desulfarculaceae bacterium]MCF8071576.1 MFS transporter [Desulfarculaceae bacterium]MCF8102391.1 MFS transporter [Desulfarculaceae bacterium]MCF8114855.1 MFS transporter [Desulfarculaceae bacterium]
MAAEPARPDYNPEGGLGQAVPALLFLTSIFFLNFATRMVLAPLMPAMEHALGMGHAEAGSLFLCVAAGYCLSMLGGGYLAARLDHRRTIIISILAVGLASLALAAGQSLAWLRASAFLLGLGAGPYLPSGLATIASLVNPRYLGRAVSVHELAPTITFVVVPLAAAALMTWFSWRVVLASFGTASLLAGLVFWAFGKGGRFKGEALSLGSIRQEALSLPLWRLTGVFTLILSSSAGVFAMLPLFLVNDHHLPLPEANLLVGMSRLVGIPLVLVGGWVADRLGLLKTMLAVTAVIGAATLGLGFSHGWVLTVLVFIQPALAGCFFPAAFAALAYIGPLETSNLRISITVAFAITVGFGLVPAGIGALAEVSSFGVGISALGGMLLLSLLLFLPGLPMRERAGLH